MHSLIDVWRIFGQTYWPPDGGASLYRPLTSVAFSLQWAIGGGSPLPFHIFSILLYAAACVAMFHLASRILPQKAALVAAAIFAVHPVHVEAVANIVGQAELWVAFILIAAVSYYLDIRAAGSVSRRQIAALSGMYCAALMFKENAIVLPALVVAAEIILPSARHATWRVRLRSVAPLLVSLTLVAVMFVAVRAVVIGNVLGGGNPSGALAGLDFPSRLFTMLHVVLEWIRLFLWPADLSADYSSHRIDPATAFDATMIPGIVVIVGACAFAIKQRRAQPALALALCWVAITMAIPSNLFVVTGFILAERSLFLASAGVAIVIGNVSMTFFDALSSHRQKQLGFALFAVIIAAGVTRSSYRNPVWKDNDTLFRQTVADAPSDWKAHFMLGETLGAEGRQKESVVEISLAVLLSKKNNALVRAVAGAGYHKLGMRHTALKYYMEAMAIAPNDTKVRLDAAFCLAQLGRVDEARVIAKEGLRRVPGDSRLTELLGMLATGSLKVFANAKINQSALQ